MPIWSLDVADDGSPSVFVENIEVIERAANAGEGKPGDKNLVARVLRGVTVEAVDPVSLDRHIAGRATGVVLHHDAKLGLRAVGGNHEVLDRSADAVQVHGA